MSDSHTVTDGLVVTMHYKLTLDGGEVVDSSEGNEPLAYLHGAQNIVPGLEKEITGKSVGDKFDVDVIPEEGYGPRVDEAVQVVDRGAFPPDANLEAGMAFKAVDENQNPLMGRFGNFIAQPEVPLGITELCLTKAALPFGTLDNRGYVGRIRVQVFIVEVFLRSGRERPGKRRRHKNGHQSENLKKTLS